MAPAGKPGGSPAYDMQQDEYNGGGWATHPNVAQQQQQYPGASRAEMMGDGPEDRRHELPGAK
jgi:hypothetical protein